MRATVTTTLCKLSAKELATRKQSTSRHNFYYSSNCVKKKRKTCLARIDQRALSARTKLDAIQRFLARRQAFNAAVRAANLPARSPIQ